MINLLEGVPGSGKSYEAVVYHVLPALKSGRKVITNLPLNLQAFQTLFPELVHLIEVRKASMPILGRWDAEAANRGQHAFLLGEFEPCPVLDDTGKLHVSEPEVFVSGEGVRYLPPSKKVPLFGSVWDFYSDWRGKDGIGPIFVIDECHVSFPKPKRGNASGTAPEVIEWFKLSRHFGSDVLLMTQRMGALEEDIAGLAEFHIRVRKSAFLGKPDQYTRRVFAGYRGGEVSNDQRHYMSQFFCLYKSHTQGQTVIENRESDVTPSHVKWRNRGLFCMVVGFAGIAWIVGGIFWGNDKPKKPSGGLQPIAMGSSPNPVLVKPAVLTAQAPAVVELPKIEEPQALPDPLETKLLHMTGCMERLATGESICTFAVSQNGLQVFSVTSVELQQIGYEFKYLGHCASVLKWKTGSMRSVVCDSPSVGMSIARIS